MLKKLKGSLTLRIFLITSAFMLAACAITYGAIAYLTPISYTSLLTDELESQSITLVHNLSQGTASESEDILQEFARQTGADMRLIDEAGEEKEANDHCCNNRSATTCCIRCYIWCCYVYEL